MGLFGSLGKSKEASSPPKQIKLKPQKAKNLPPFMTIDVGTREVKIMVAAYKGNSLVVKKCASIELPEKAVYDGKIIDEVPLLNALKSLISTHKVSVKGAVVTISSSEAIQREITVPLVSGNDLHKVVLYEIAKYLPVDVDSYAIQYDVLEQTQDEAGAAQLRMSVSAMPKSMAKKYYDVITKLGLQPLSLCTHSHSIINLVTAETSCGSAVTVGTNVLLDMGSTHFNIMLFKDGNLLYNNMLNVGGHDVDDLIMNWAEIGLHDAEKLKKHNLSNNNAYDMYSIYASMDPQARHSGDKGERIMREIMSVFENWITAVDGFIKYYLSRDDENTVDTMYIYGGSASINGIDVLLERQLRIRVRRLESLECLTGNLKGDSEMAKYINNLGATIQF